MKKCRYITLFKQNAEGEKTSILDVTTSRFIIQINFSMPGEKYELVTMWIDDFIGDTPQDFADSLQGWVDKLRSL